MPRIARIVASGYPCHVTQRGNCQQPIFDEEDDFRQYLLWLKEYASKYLLNIWAYCLMTNHVNFVCVPIKEDSLARTFSTLHMRYSQEKEDVKIIRNIKKCSMTGRPCGDDSFVKKLEQYLGRRLMSLPWGRPRKQTKL